jgi:hypothetical protein
VRLLEPSPPAVDDGDFFADDPAVRGNDLGADGRPVVGPTSEADISWTALSSDDPELAAWCAARWLGPWPRLESLPEGYGDTREALRRLAVYVLAPARKAVTGKIGLRSTLGGFGTPFFGDDEQLRVEGAALVHQRGDSADIAEITSLATLAAFTGVPLGDDPGVGADIPALGDGNAPLTVNPSAGAAVGAWFGFGASVLEQRRAELNAGGRDCSRVQLWPEHFDLGASIEGLNFGCSPGDAFSAEPYVYVGPWSRDGLDGEFWNAPFGAALRYQEILAAEDQRETALGFLRRGAELAFTRAAPQP